VSYITKNLMAGEKIVHRARIHWNGYLGPAAVAAALAAAGVFFQSLMVTFGVAAVVCLPWLLAVHVGRLSSEFAVTNRRIVIKAGVFGRNSTEILLDRIEGVQVVQTVVDCLLDRGTLIFTGTGGNRVEVKNIHRPQEFRRGVQVGIEDLERSRTKHRPETEAAA